MPERRLCIVTEIDQNETLQSIIALRDQILVLGLFSATIMALLGFLIARMTTKPIAKLVKGVHEIGLGNLDYHIKLHGNDEFSRLATAFNDMSNELARKNTENVHLYQETRIWTDQLEKRVEERTARIQEEKTLSDSVINSLAEISTVDKPSELKRSI